VTAAKHIRLSWVLWGAIVVTALIAFNRGIDLLWGTTILLVIATLAASLLPKLQLHGLTVERGRFPSSGTVGQPLEVSYRVQASGWLPRYGIEIHDNLPALVPNGITAFIARVKGTQDHAFSWIPRVRGCWRLGAPRVESRYPLGLTKASRTAAPSTSQPENAEVRELVIYPDFVPLRWLPLRGEANPQNEQRITRSRGGHDEFFAVRSYRPHDSLRSVHWRASARMDELVVKEYEQQQDRQLWIVLELSEDEHVGEGPDGTFEYMIRIAHSVAVKAMEEGVPFGLVYDSGERIEHLGPALDRAHYLQVREALARVNPHARSALTSNLDRLWEALPGGGCLLLFTPRDPRGRAELSSRARRHAAHPMYVEFDHDSFVRGERNARVRTQHTQQGLVSIVAYGADLTELFRT